VLLCTGFIWSISDISFFLANQTLSESESFPIINDVSTMCVVGLCPPLAYLIASN